jgi:hypothetical protein
MAKPGKKRLPEQDFGQCNGLLSSYGARLPTGLSNGQKPRYGFAWYICLCPAQQA